MTSIYAISKESKKLKEIQSSFQYNESIFAEIIFLSLENHMLFHLVVVTSSKKYNRIPKPIKSICNPLNKRGSAPRQIIHKIAATSCKQVIPHHLTIRINITISLTIR